MGKKQPLSADKEIEITTEMITEGVRAYFDWDYGQEDIEALVAMVYYRMELKGTCVRLPRG